MVAEHSCAATGCQAQIPRKLLMCRPHWASVPRALKRSVWDSYRPGQELDGEISADYLRAMAQAFAAVDGLRVR